MRALLVIKTMLLAGKLAAATGDIIGLEVEPNGWVLKATIQGLNTNGNFNNGLGTNNQLTGLERLKLNVRSMGFNDDGTSTIWPREIVANVLLRRPHPNNTIMDVQPQGGDCVARFALSDFVHAKDSNITATARAGYYGVTNGVGTNATAFSEVAVTNSSTQQYPKVIANWAWPGNQLIGNPFSLRVTAQHGLITGGKPVACVAFIAATTNTSVTNFQTRPVIDRSTGDAIPLPEYIGHLDSTTFSNGAIVRCDFIAYPVIGDADSKVSTLDNAWNQPHGNYAAITNVCNRLGNYGISYAVVAETNSSSAGLVVTNLNPSSPPAAFDTIARAQAAIASSNSIWFGRTNSGGSVIYLRGSNLWTGAGSASGVGQRVWTTYSAYPGDGEGSANVYGQASAYTMTIFDKFENVKIQSTAALLIYTLSPASLWLDRCFIGLTGLNPLSIRAIYLTRNRIAQLSQGARPFAGNNVMFALVRGNTITNLGLGCLAYTVLGNKKHLDSESSVMVYDAYPGMAAQAPSAPIIGHNFISVSNGLALSITRQSNWVGCAVVGNVFEQTQNTTYLGSIMELDDKPVTNLIIWNNSSMGQRWNLAYNSINDSNPAMMHFSVSGNIWTALANKSDVFFPPNGNRTGNWPVVFGTGWRDNMVLYMTNVQTSSFPLEFGGINYWAPRNSSELPTSEFLQFTQWKSFNGITGNSGGGDYRILSSSPIRLLFDKTKPPYPFDSDGHPRSEIDRTGAYGSANPIRGSLF